MTEAAFDPAALDPLDDIELEFDDAAPIAPVEVTAKKTRRAPAKGRAAAEAEIPAPATELPPSAAPAPAAAEEPADPPAPLPLPDAGSAGSTLSAATTDRRQRLLTAIVCLALFTSLMSLGGLIAASRTLADLARQRGQVSDDRAALARIPAMIAAIERASARLPVAPAAAPAAPVAAGRALTADDLHRGLDDLRLALDNRQPAGMGAMAGTMQAGLAEIGTRLDRIEAAIPPRTPRPAPPPKRD